MFEEFSLADIPLDKISLDTRNPRLVTRKPLASQQEIIDYLFEHEELTTFLQKVVGEGRNPGAERPYVIESATGYVVVEGNTRIAAYKLLAGLESAPAKHKAKVPVAPASLKNRLETIECSVAPDRESLLPIMANAHFGRGDKTKWGYLGSRKAVYDEWKSGRTVGSLANAFARKKGQIRDYLIEYQLYLQALELDWSEEEREALEDPSVEFNPPVRFLQSQGHKEKVGIEIDREQSKIKFKNSLAKKKFKHLIARLVTDEKKKFKATSSYEEVFKDFKPSSDEPGPTSDDPVDEEPSPAPKLKKGALFSYPVKSHNQLIQHLAKEAATLNCNLFPASGTFLLRNLLEAILKHIIDENDANKSQQLLSLEKSLDICIGKSALLPPDDIKILKEFKSHHLNYVNLGSHATVIPNSDRLFAARDAIDQFIMRNM
jgi:hypothetical protein